MEANKKYPAARELTYGDFQPNLCGMMHKKMWKERKAKFSIGRLYYAHPSSGERYYLRMLLNIVKGCTSYKNIRTVNGVEYPTFKEAY
jgi:hypothetical protein